METILIVDDDGVERRLLYHVLKRDYRVLEAETHDAALELLDRGPIDLVILDLHLPPHPDTPAEGIRIFRAVADRAPVVVTTGDQDRSLALEMVRQGVGDFLQKPVDPQVLKIVVERVLLRRGLEAEVRRLREAVGERPAFGRLIGRSPAMEVLFEKLTRLAASSSTILFLGESGTGKSALARAVHEASPRREKPFVVVDAASLTESLLESELFGHVKGAFTGAVGDRTGRLELADQGTLFLDEIGNLSPGAQAKLLLFLDERAFSPVGSSRRVPVDVRLIVATNRSLPEMVEWGTFRADLLYRITVAAVEVPPLRARREDIALLAELLLGMLGRETGHPTARLTAEAALLLESYPWPGNVRQLKHVLEHSLILAPTEVLDARDLLLPTVTEAGGGAAEPAPTAAPLSEEPRSFKDRMAAFERRQIEDALAATAGNKAAAARRLGLDEHQIHYLCRKHGLS